MNVLERERVQRWRADLHECWIEANGDAEQAKLLFQTRKPMLMPPAVWAMILEVAVKLLVYWIKHPPQVVMTAEEARYLEMETD